MNTELCTEPNTEKQALGMCVKSKLSNVSKFAKVLIVYSALINICQVLV
jgi:hypothetical protein